MNCAKLAAVRSVGGPLPRPAPLLPLLLALGGCFTPEAPGLEVDLLPFENAYTTAPDILLQAYTWDGLPCPDGGPATFYAVWREGAPTPAPVVVVFHAGSFDYVISPNGDDVTAGPHYQEENRLDSDWASTKVFETLGLLPGTSTDVNLGIIPAKLAEAGVFALYPANCWGDLWHNETGYQPNAEEDYFDRNGRSMAWATLGMFSEDEATRETWRSSLHFEEPIALDASRIGLIGLGEGGHAIPELLRRGQFVPSREGSSSVVPPLTGVALDSTMDNLYPVWADDATFGRFNAGLDRIYPDDYANDIGQYSLARWLGDHTMTTPVTVVWSSNDPEVPADTLAGLVAQADGDLVVARDTGENGHVFSNANPELAQLVVSRVLGN